MKKFLFRILGAYLIAPYPPSPHPWNKEKVPTYYFLVSVYSLVDTSKTPGIIPSWFLRQKFSSFASLTEKNISQNARVRSHLL